MLPGVHLVLAAAALLSVPYVPQRAEGCGPAALTMVLRFWGRPVLHDEVAAALADPELRGTAGSRLAEVAAGEGLRAVALRGDRPLLEESLARGRPVVVALDLGGPLLHDVVVVGLEEGGVVVHDPARGAERRLGWPRFLRSWSDAGGWALIVAPPAEDPPTPAASAAPPAPVPESGPESGGEGDGPSSAYDALVRSGVALAKAGDRAGAAAALEQARALVPGRPEALVELAGLHFLDARYADAIALLHVAVRQGGGPLALDMMAAALHLSGRADEALEAWNRMERPVLRNVRVEGVFGTRSRLLVPQVALVEGTLLTRDAVRETRLRLQETGAFDRVRVRPVPLGGALADAELVVSERRGLGAPAELAALTLSKLLQHTAWVDYRNAAGAGLSLTGGYRWPRPQQLGQVRLGWPRPLGLDATLLAEGRWQGQDYDLDGDLLRLDARWADVGLRHVLGPRTVGELRWRGGRRTFTGSPVASAQGGRVSGLAARVEHRLSDGWRHRLDADARVFAAPAALGSEVHFTTGRLTLRDTIFLAPPEHVTLERSVLAAQVVAGGGSAATPLDAFFVPGAASEMMFPLRAHPDRTDGVLGRSPIGRSLGLLNLEWRQRVARAGPAQAGLVLFYDGAWVGGRADGTPAGALHDLGLGLRLGLFGVVVRADCAWSLNGGSAGVLTAGIGQVF